MDIYIYVNYDLRKFIKDRRPMGYDELKSLVNSPIFNLLHKQQIMNIFMPKMHWWIAFHLLFKGLDITLNNYD